MNKEERALWLKDKNDRINFAKELQELSGNPALQRIIEDMIKMRVQLISVFDDDSSSVELVRETQRKRATIKWFINAFVNSINAGEQAKKEIEKYQKFEKEKEALIAKKLRVSAPKN